METFDLHVHAAAPAADVFAVLADASRWHEWAGPMIDRSEWEREGDPAPGGVGAIRRLGRWPMFTREQIVEYEPPSHLAYTSSRGSRCAGTTPTWTSTATNGAARPSAGPARSNRGSREPARSSPQCWS